MTRTKLDTPAFADQSVDTRNIADGTVQAQDIAPGGVSAAKLPDTLDLSSKTVTLPNASVANAKLANSSITLNGSAVSLGGSTSIIPFLDWQAVVVADGSTTLNAVAGRGYFLDTNTGVIEIFLPSSPSRGDTFAFVDYSGTFATNRIIINTQGVSIDSSITDGSTAGSEYQVTTDNAIVELVFVDSAKGYQVVLNKAAGTTPNSVLTDGVYDNDLGFTQATGGTITTSGDFKIHSFTGDGTFCVSFAGNSAAFPGNPLAGPNSADYLVVAGGGSGSGGGGAGGGAGGYRTSGFGPSPLRGDALTLTASSFPVTVGAGGAVGPACVTRGSNSVFSTITSTGGGGGTSQTGGSGSGGRGPGSSGAAGNTPPVSPSQGNSGGDGGGQSGGSYFEGGGGGGGATASGSQASGQNGGNGGAGAPNEITGSDVSYAGGGGGGIRLNSPGTQGTGGSGGAGGGGAGGNAALPQPNVNGSAGSANTGGGGGGGGLKNPPAPEYPGPGAAGGKGIVVIRYKFQ